jgi:hypothetical protein
MATVPQHLAVSASISNDLAAELVVVLILWLAIKRAKNTVSNHHFIILGGILYGAALLTKTTAYVPGTLLLIAAEIAHFRVLNCEFRISNSGKLLTLFALGLLIASPMFIRNALTYDLVDPLGLARHDAIVVGQPMTAEMIARHGFARIAFDFVVVTFKSFWAQFGWMGVLIDDRIYVLLCALTGVALFGFLLWALRIVRQRELLPETQHWCVGFMILLFAVAFADYVAYNFKFLQFQGRYLFPALISIAFFLVIGLRELIAREYQRIVFALLYVALLALDWACLFLFIVPQLRIAN